MSIAYFISYCKKDSSGFVVEEGSTISLTHPLRWINEQQKEHPEFKYQLLASGKLVSSELTMKRLSAHNFVQP